MPDIVTLIESLAGHAKRIAMSASGNRGRNGEGGVALASIADEAAQLATRSAGLAQSLTQSIRLLNRGQFTFRTLQEARSLASVVAGLFPDPKRVEVGICELLLNAVEHGNLGITYEEKSELLARGGLEEEVTRRLTLPLYAERLATLDVQRLEGGIRLVVTDQGKGFDWRPYLEFSAERAADAHGRGIATARLLCFTKLEYRGNGNEVVAELDVAAVATPVSATR